MTTEPNSTSKRDRGDLVRAVAGIVALILLVAFVTANSQSVTVSFLFFRHSIGLIWALLFSALLGAGVTAMVLHLRRHRRGR